jgi:hypothetical protein
MLDTSKEEQPQEQEDKTKEQVPTRKGGPIRLPKANPVSKEDRKQVILNALHVGLSVATAAKIAGIDRRLVYTYAQDDEFFKQAMSQEQSKGVKEVADSLMESAIAGNVKAQIFWLSTRAEEFQNKPQMSDAEVVLLEKIVSTMMNNRLLPDDTGSTILIGLN